jgi:hypothetical protein
MMTVRILPFALAVATLAACSSGNGSTASTPTPVLPPPATGSTGPTATGPTGSFPTTSPGSATGKLTSGEVTFQLSGDVEVEKTLRSLTNAVYAPPPGGLAIVWTAGGTDASTIGLGGGTFTGTQPTSPTLSVSVTAQTSDGIARFLSIDGECEVTIDVALRDEISGSFSCTGLVGSAGEVVAVSASFRATG